MYVRIILTRSKFLKEIKHLKCPLSSGGRFAFCASMSPPCRHGKDFRPSLLCGRQFLSFSASPGRSAIRTTLARASLEPRGREEKSAGLGNIICGAEVGDTASPGKNRQLAKLEFPHINLMTARAKFGQCRRPSLQDVAGRISLRHGARTVQELVDENMYILSAYCQQLAVPPSPVAGTFEASRQARH